MRVPTSRHAASLFELTMESRYGISWPHTVEGEVVEKMARAIVRGFGGVPTRGKDGQWRFPDGSFATVGDFGVRQDADLNAAPA